MTTMISRVRRCEESSGEGGLLGQEISDGERRMDMGNIPKWVT